MGPWSRVRVAKCQMLVTSFFVLLLGLSMATLAALTYFGAHFAVIGHASSDRTPYEAVHRWAFYAAISLAGLLTLGAVLGAAATVREAGGLMAGVSSPCPQGEGQAFPRPQPWTRSRESADPGKTPGAARKPRGQQVGPQRGTGELCCVDPVCLDFP
uniref:Tetraspanin 32 n=1 Tax=Ursus americanus TaxID=9643 RepID=A0A452SFY5_URSAM